MNTRISHVPCEGPITSSQAWLDVGQVMSRAVLAVSSHETVLAATRSMAEKNVSCIVVTDQGSPVGILTETDLLRRIAQNENDFDTIPVKGIMSSPLETIGPGTSVFEASRIMEEKQIKRLPVVEEKALVGIITQTDLVRVLTSYCVWADVRRIMNEDVPVLQCNATVPEAARVMSARGISCIVALKGNQVAGVLTERDLLKRVIAQQKDPAHTAVAEVMSSPAITIPADYSVFSASRLMEKMSIRRLVVMEGGRMCGIVAQTDIFRAVKEKLETEDEENLERLEKSESNVFTTNLDGITTYVNPAFMRLFAVSDPEEFVNQPFLPERFWINPEQRAAFLNEQDRGSTKARELALKTAEGKRIYVTLFSTFTKNSEGEINGSQGILHDLTEKNELLTLRKAQQALRESERRYRLLAENAKDVIWTSDLSFRWTYISPSVELLRGFTAEESMAHTPDELLTPASAELARRALVEELTLAEKYRDAPQRVRSLELEFKCKDGSTIWTEAKVSFLCGADERPVGLVGVVRDVTERKRAEGELAKAKEAAEKANRIKSEFLANIGHEIRTPMTAILGYADLLMTPQLSEQQRNTHLQMIRRNGEILLDLINDILDLSRIEAGEVAVEYTECSLWQIVDDVISLMRLPAQKKDLSLEVDYLLPLPQTIRTDPVRLRQILVNLLGNAVKFTEQGGVRIAVRCTQNANTGPRIHFSVTDTGIGVTPELAEKLFEPWTQADASTSRRYGGTGLGLTISKRLAEALGGDINLESQPGRGSKFTVTIHPGSLQGVPMLGAPSKAAAGREGPADAGQNQTLRGRVLLAEDGPDNQRLILLLLQQSGLTVDLAENGRIACEKALDSETRGRPYDLILMDMQMPDWDGYEATRWLRQNGWRRPVIALTAHAMADDRQRCLESGCDDYLNKPIDRIKFLATLGRHLGSAARRSTFSG